MSDDDNIKFSKTHLRIDFVVQEVSDDGVHSDDLRYVRFGDDVDLGNVRDFFDRCGQAMGLMFRHTGSSVIQLVSCDPTRKIASIKLLREFGGYGLKEAKDLIEAPAGTAILVVPNVDDLVGIVRQFNDAGTKVAVKRVDDLGAIRPELGLPPLGSYKGRQ